MKSRLYASYDGILCIFIERVLGIYNIKCRSFVVTKKGYAAAKNQYAEAYLKFAEACCGLG